MADLFLFDPVEAVAGYEAGSVIAEAQLSGGPGTPIVARDPFVANARPPQPRYEPSTPASGRTVPPSTRSGNAIAAGKRLEFPRGALGAGAGLGIAAAGVGAAVGLGQAGAGVGHGIEAFTGYEPPAAPGSPPKPAADAFLKALSSPIVLLGVIAVIALAVAK